MSFILFFLQIAITDVFPPSSDPWIHFCHQREAAKLFGHAARLLDNIPADTEFIDELRSHMQVAHVTWVIVVSHTCRFQR